MASSQKTIFITGASSGFGRELATQAVARGDKVVATARRPEELEDLVNSAPERVLALRLDVTSKAEIKQAVRDALARFGQIDVLINNAGYGLMGALEEVSDADIRRQIDTNLVGVIDMTRAVLPAMREARSGHVINISSIAGLVGLPGVSLYNATKFAVAGLSEALAKETEHLGIRVTSVEPGAFRTDFNGRSLGIPSAQIADYAASAGERVRWLEEMDGEQPGDPVKAANAILDLTTSKEPPVHLVLGEDALDMAREKNARFMQKLDRNASISTAMHLDDAA